MMLPASAQWRAHSCITSRAEFCGKASNHPGDSALLQPVFGTLKLLAFPKTKTTFEREEISDYQWDSGKYDGAADGNWENCEVPRCLLWRGLSFIVLCTLFLVSPSVNVSFFPYYMAGYLLDRPCIYLLLPHYFWNYHAYMNSMHAHIKIWFSPINLSLLTRRT